MSDEAGENAKSSATNVNLDLLTTISALGDLVVAQNGALIEISKLVYEQKINSGEQTALIPLNECLQVVKNKSDEYIQSLKTTLAAVSEAQQSPGDA